ncbi:cytochrome c oxidase subunit 3 [Silvibacterium dinghuense]|uniref:Heme-copper oxidase subunit III n=1 Tax=Silvibacterium dinghuense TaxID=1560006 RepID=A0A4Q1SA79_9BACT|nr:heme-copper oxidase subunit III [Silvibacterium dinghuense]RXS93839.1 heme-copper oxidase subunit III [Silvibacterium dinghuense]GGH08128.1 cytochrome b6 [Silvibacterium dinghuense]
MSAIPLTPHISDDQPWKLPSKGKVGMYCLIVAESAIFIIFVLAYLFYIGKTTFGPTPAVLEVPIINSIALLSSSITIMLAERALEHGKMKGFSLWWAITIALGSYFLYGTGVEWYKLIHEDGLTISTNLFGTTFYSLVGLHATHVIFGLIGLTLTLIFALTGKLKHEHNEKVQILALYWHFVDAIWIVVFTVVYIIGR